MCCVAFDFEILLYNANVATSYFNLFSSNKYTTIYKINFGYRLNTLTLYTKPHRRHSRFEAEKFLKFIETKTKSH